MPRTALLGVVALSAVIISAGSPSVALADNDDHGRTFEVTVTNITPGSGETSGQILNGLVVVAHNRHVRLFELGQPASEELAMLAEDAMNEELVTVLSRNPDVCDVQTHGGGILPGASASVMITAKGRCRHLSLAAMLVTTNDAFAGLNGVRLRKRGDKFLALAYDAGSEANTENCSDIPGPPCGMINRVGGGEGYVSIHSGIHGIGVDGLVIPADRDWRNPVAYITIDSVDGDDDDD